MSVAGRDATSESVVVSPAARGGREATSAPRPGGAIRLVAIDLDGTLLRTDKRLSVRCAEAIAEAARRGVRVVLASARPPRSVSEVHRRLGLDTVQVNYNGALIHDLPRYRHIYHCPLPARLALRIARLARRVDPEVLISAEILDRWYTDRVDEALATETSKRQQPDHLGPIEGFLNVPVTKLMLLGPPHRLGAVHGAVRRRFGRKVGLLVSDRHLLQVVNRRVDKAGALARVAHGYGTDRAQVMAIGDAPNDVGMLRWAGFGVAMQNGWALAREAADCVVPSNDDDGVAHAIERYVL
ncbi:MAG: Cof-type HAD-IIB family hydrolase [Phycisphaeraceae bacterium]